MTFSRTRLLLVAVAAPIAMIAATTAPAAAEVESLVAVDLNGTVGGYNVVSTCSPVLVASTDARFLTFALKASADATGPSVPLATTVTCTMRDATNNQPVGGASGALPGPHAEAVGTATLPFGHLYKLCVSGGASFLNGYSLGSKPC